MRTPVIRRYRGRFIVIVSNAKLKRTVAVMILIFWLAMEGPS